MNSIIDTTKQDLPTGYGVDLSIKDNRLEANITDSNLTMDDVAQKIKHRPLTIILGGDFVNLGERLPKVETEFKTLMYNGDYVAVNLSADGIYPTESPVLYSKEDTIESIIERGLRNQKTSPFNFNPDKCIENLRKCKLVPIEIKIKDR